MYLLGRIFIDLYLHYVGNQESYYFLHAWTLSLIKKLHVSIQRFSLYSLANRYQHILQQNFPPRILPYPYTNMKLHKAPRIRARTELWLLFDYCWPFIIFSKSRINKNVSGLPSLLNTCAGMFLLSLDTFKCTYIQATCRPMITVCLDMLPLMHDLINN